MKISVYALLDPDTRQVKYIGVTKSRIEERLAGHIQASKEGELKVHRWIRSLKNHPIVKLIEVVPFSIWEKTEIKWIAHFRRKGIDLTNSSDGGKGATGSIHSERSRRKRSEMMKGNRIRKGKKTPISTRMKISKSLIGNDYRKGIKHDSKTKLKISIASKRNWSRKEFRIKHAKSMKLSLKKRGLI